MKRKASTPPDEIPDEKRLRWDQFQCQFIHPAGHQCEKIWNIKVDDRTLASHMFRHKNGVGMFQCVHVDEGGTRCEKSYAAKDDLARHEYQHKNGVNFFQCTYVDSETKQPCGRSFHRRTGLTRHRLTHTGEKPFQCEFVDSKTNIKCQKALSTKEMLKLHMLTHTGERPFPCTFRDLVTGAICKRAFAQSGALRKHTRAVHNGEKQFRCDFVDLETNTSCTKAFARRQHLATHMRYHLGIKPYHCTTCDNSFATAYSLACHTRVHTGGRPYPCDVDDGSGLVCGETFRYASHLKRHFKRWHTEEGQRIRKVSERQLELFFESQGLTKGVDFDREVQIDYRCSVDDEDDAASSDCKAFARLDFVFRHLREDCDLLVENDENGHDYEDIQCQASRMMDVRHSTLRAGQTRPQLIFRFNPDAFRKGLVLQSIKKKDRYAALWHHMCTQPAPKAGGLAIVYLFYNVNVRGELVKLDNANLSAEFKKLVRAPVVSAKIS